MRPVWLASSLLGLACLGCQHGREAAMAPDAAQAAAAMPCPKGATCLTAEEVARAQIVTTPVAASSGHGTVMAAGRVAFDDLQVAHVVSPLSGRLASIDVKLGQWVEQQAPLATLHAPQMGATLANATAALADEVAAKRELARQAALFAEHAVAAKEFEAAQNRSAQARATAHQAVQRRALLGGNNKLASDAFVLRAPLAGKVMTRNVAVGTEVTGTADAGPQAPVLFTIGSLASVWVVGDVFAIDAANIRLGAAVSIHVTAFPGRSWPSKVDWLSTTVDAASGAIRVRCRLINPEGLLKPEMTASLHIDTAAAEGLWVPEGSIYYLRGLPHVFVAEPLPEGGLACRRRRVQVGNGMADGRLLLADGVRPGELVVSGQGIWLTAEDS